jgi:hypothetical protein
MNEQHMKQLILQVLSDWKSTQLNMASESGRAMLAEALVQRLIRTNNAKLANDERVK